jgi:Protein of unknown function (DUF3551)
MKTMMTCAAVAVLCAMATRAEAQGAFCAEDAHGYRNCGFYTLAQCRQSLAGMGGTCSPNPAAPAAVDQAQTPTRKRARPDR